MTLGNSTSVRFQEDAKVKNSTPSKTDEAIELAYKIDATEASDKTDEPGKIGTRFQKDAEVINSTPSKTDEVIELTYKIARTKAFETSEKTDEPGKINESGSKQAIVQPTVFSVDSDIVNKMILDPQGSILHKWNKILLVACIVSLFIDPLFFYLPVTQEFCIDIHTPLQNVLTVMRSVVDVFYVIKIIVRFRTAFVAPSTRLFGRGELVTDLSKIASRYLAKAFWIDLLAALPLPQLLIWAVIPNLKGSTVMQTKNSLLAIVICQYMPRLFLIFQLSSQIIKEARVVSETAWTGALFNLIIIMLVSHVAGGSWYLLSIGRQESCWTKVCNLERSSCKETFFNCRSKNAAARDAWFKSSNITDLCDVGTTFIQYGIYEDAVSFNITSSAFITKYFYSLGWGLRNLNNTGETSTSVGEILFSISMAILGLVLFGVVIGNAQTYLLSTSVRLEQWRIRRMDIEQWLSYRNLPSNLKQRVRRYEQYRWVATQEVDEEAILNELHIDLRRDIKRHICLDLVRRVPLFDEMDEGMLDAICERLRLALCNQGTCLVREGDPLDDMAFIIRGYLDSCTTDGGRTGFFDSSRLGPGDFCGEELLTWALDPRSSDVLPLSTRTAKALTDVEAFALGADDLRFVASQFRKLHSKELRHKFRFYSHQWRTWAACCIQAAWRRYKRRKELAALRAKEKEATMEKADESEEADGKTEGQQPAFSVQAGRLAAIQAARRQFKRSMELVVSRASEGMVQEAHEGVDSPMSRDGYPNTFGRMPKPDEPDFSYEEEE